MTSMDEIKTEYTSSLADLTFNSKPLINVLTMLAEENLPNAKIIVEAIEEHLSKVATDVKLPILYLIDCIVKNVGQTYTTLFSQNIVSTFCSVFKVVDEKTRSEMFKLRQTWNDVFPQKKLYAIDVQIRMIDPAWPVTAQPSNSIHLNPKFLKGTSTPTKTKLSTIQPESKPVSGDIDKETLLMQEQLIQKKKELLELQRKTLELEVLQTQVKLQEQMKAVAPPLSTNILLKPEVAKQLIPEAVSKTGPTSITNQKMQNNATTQLKINPVNPALAAAKPIRDPRLLRQQQQQKSLQEQQKPVSNENQPVVFPTTNISSQETTIFENNKSVTNKPCVRDTHKDPRLINKSDKRSKTSSKSLQQCVSDSNKNTETVQKSDSQKSSSSNSSSGSLSSSSTSSLDSLSKNKSRSSSKHKKRDKSESNGSQSAVESSSKRGKLSPKIDNTFSKSTSDERSSTFKNVKNSTKNRNYMRRNLNESPLPPQDEDLRALSSTDKQARIQQTDANIVEQAPVTTTEPPTQPMDVDLRQLTLPLNKKRSSTDVSEQLSKKNKSFDMLFGNEDTDLRQLPVTAERDRKASNTLDRPPTPPPPIISTKEQTETKPTIQSPKKNDLDAVRAKLANATNREKVLLKSFNKRKLQNETTGDLDLRVASVPPPNVKGKITISPEEEEVIKSGHMTKEQEKQILNKIFIQIEKDKLREAKKKDQEESFGNVSLQPISDDEFGSDFEETLDKREDVDDRNNQPQLQSRPTTLFNDKDERLHMPHMSQISNNFEDTPGSFYPNANVRRPPFRGALNWRGRGRGIPPQGPPQPRQPIRPWVHQQQVQHKWRNAPPQGGHFMPPDFNQMPIDDDASRSPGQDLNPDFTVHQEDNKTLNIDGIPRDIRIYNDTAIIFINWDDPRDISFQSGMRRVIFNNKESYILSFGDNYKECLISGVPFRVKLGVPSREIFINDISFECFFGGAPVNVMVNGMNITVQLEGPPPQVKIGETKRTDLVVGKINLIINAKIIVPVFLDAKVQKFVIDGETNTLKFVDSLKRVLINDVPFNVEFGGLPKPFTVHGRKHFIRFSVLPKGVKPGFVKIKDMEGETSVNLRHTESSNEAFVDPVANEALRPDLNVVKQPTDKESPDNTQSRSNSPSFFTQILQPGLNNFDVISNVFSTSLTSAPSSGSYQVEIPGIAPATEPREGTVPQTTVSNTPPININELFQKLVASGFVKTIDTNKTSQQDEISENGNTASSSEHIHPIRSSKTSEVQNVEVSTKKHTDNNSVTTKYQKKNLSEILKPVTFTKPETLKIRQGLLYTTLYSGMQCSSCGMRFPPEASMLYSQHLDWHFRQNRRGKKNARVASSRRWYYSLTDWKNYEEIEDLEEREKSYFDQQQQAEIAEEAYEETEVPSVLADPGRTDERCQVCRDAFEQFFNEEKEEWHLKNAIKVDDKTYHPVCYEDHQQSITEITLDDSKVEEESSLQQNKLIPGLEIILDDDEDEEMNDPKTPNEVVSLIESDDLKMLDDDKNIHDSSEKEEDDDDDDVILNEVAPIKIVVDDDDDDDDQSFNQQLVNQPLKIKKDKHVDDDGFVDVGEGLVSLNKVGQIKIKSEPMDEDDILSVPQELNLTSESAETPVSESEPATSQPEVVTTHPQMITSIDGNVELVSSTPTLVQNTLTSGPKIKINISKSLPVIPPKESSEPSVNSETEMNVGVNETPMEEPRIVNYKPALKNVPLKKLPPVRKGHELTGLCSIM